MMKINVLTRNLFTRKNTHCQWAMIHRRCPTVLRTLTITAIVLSGYTGGSVFADGLNNSDYLYDGKPDARLVELGRNLFFDPILSGNRNISCATCHDPALGTSDALALGLGEGASGIGTNRSSTNALLERIPRNAPALWNVGARANAVLFHDGRIEPDSTGRLPNGISSPAGDRLPLGLDSTLAAQALFPPLSPVEMAGQPQENAIANAVSDGQWELAWDILADRLRGVSEYVELFAWAFPDVEVGTDIQITHAANALAAFQTVAFRADQSPFDEFLRTGSSWLFSDAERRGMNLFYNQAGCAACHSGPLLTDHQFHAIAMPQIGPGKGHGSDTSFEDFTGYSERLEDEGRFAITGDPFDVFKFRTPSLRNVTDTAPYGHDGAYATLDAVVRHHLDPVESLNAYAPVKLEGEAGLSDTNSHSCTNSTRYQAGTDKVLSRRDSWVHCNEQLRQRIGAANELQAIDLTEQEIQDILAFLGTLTDDRSKRLTRLAPLTVPSGLTATSQP